MQWEPDVLNRSEATLSAVLKHERMKLLCVIVMREK